MSVSAEYIANLVAELNADKAIAEEHRLSFVQEFGDCEQCGDPMDDSFGCYFCD
jgi:hypothetical protein